MVVVLLVEVVIELKIGFEAVVEVVVELIAVGVGGVVAKRSVLWTSLGFLSYRSIAW